ncbi:MAG: DMT family transporter [Firmicutes bacterium]|nr:DMT family transporter [Bacillota bacterium]
MKDAALPAPYVIRLIYGIGILGISSAAVLIVAAHANPFTIAFWRLAISSILLMPWALQNARFMAHKWRADSGRLLISAGFLAAHFAFWIASLQLIPIALSTALVSTQPLWIALYQKFSSRAAPPLKALRRSSLFLATGLLFFIIFGSRSSHSFNLYGILWALCGAISMAGYLLTSAQLRRHWPTHSYGFVVYGLSSLLLAAGQVLLAIPFGPVSWHLSLLYLAMALGPTLAGHSLFQWLLRYDSPHHAALAMVGEIPGATLLAWIFLHQIPTWADIFGMVFIFAAILTTLRAASAPANSPSSLSL